MEFARWTVLRTSEAIAGLDATRIAPEAAAEAVLVSEAIPVSAIADLENDPRTIAAAPDIPTLLIEPFSGSSAPPMDTWGVKAIGADVSAHDGNGVKVAVLDTGIDQGHPAFAGMKLTTCDFTGTGGADGNGHGTHCAGTIFGRDVGQRIGVARGVQVGLIGKVLDDAGRGTALMALEGIQWAVTQGANVISISLGFDMPGYIAKLIDGGWPDKLAAAMGLDAYRKNIRLFDRQLHLLEAQRDLGRETLIIAATGNESERVANPAFRIPAGLPAAAHGVVSAGALGQSCDGLKVAPFSNTLPTLCGPGVDIVSAWPGGAVKSLSGTSMACPHVAGAAALWWQALGSEARAETVKLRLLGAASRAGLAPGFDHTDVGLGLVRAP